MSLLAGDLSHLHLPGDLERVRDTARAALSRGESVALLYQALAATEPVALVDITLGPKALDGDAAVAEALGVVETLEAASSPAAVHRRLAALGAASEVFAAALERHPTATWLVGLAGRVEPIPGLAQLEATRSEPDFPGLCLEHARAGHVEALLEQSDAGRVEAAVALLQAGDSKGCVEAAARILAAHPNAPLAQALVDTGLDSAGPAIRALIPRLRSREAAEALHAGTSSLPDVQRLLSLVLAGLRPEPQTEPMDLA